MLKYGVYLIGLTLFGLFLIGPAVTESRATLNQDEKDRQEIIDHINGIFQAYIRQDREAIRAMHTEDWIGFKNGSRSIIKGIDGYMENVLNGQLNMLSYEIDDIHVELYGSIAHVYYVAHWRSRFAPTDEILTIRARSIDIYRKDPGGWNQAGSHLTILPRPQGLANPVCSEQCIDITVEEE